MQTSLRFPSDLSLERFIESYWQKQPLLLRGAVDPELLTLPADELAGLACEDGIESRLIRLQNGNRWSVQHGPLDESVFSNLPESHWTLLVQDADKHLPEVARLLQLVDFLPDWRIDDIMISYATDNGGVGPHTDNYDVFLVQAQGQRRWRLSRRIYTDDDLLDDCPLRVLREFDTDEDLVLNPGDVLYLPPRLGHWGTALGECMTWSIGMRGPSQEELLDAWLQHRAGTVPQRHFHDLLKPGRHPGAVITDDEFALARDLMRELLPGNDREFQQWFARYVTEPKPGFEIEPIAAPLNGEQLRTRVASGHALQRHPWARFACLAPCPDSCPDSCPDPWPDPCLEQGQPALCSQGSCFAAPPGSQALLNYLGSQRHLEPARLLELAAAPAAWEWLADLFNHGLLVFDD